ncbi:MAG TPA: exodeoxyribonuclease VII large subunit [Bacteroidales bacterium]|nr:exodeoxyribonuclease VII large subunit [Bacteroidales bacterium]
MVQKISLLELNKRIQEKININFPDSLWIIAEISELKVNRNGHCYLELIEKDIVTDNIIAKSRATIWAFTFRMLRPYFENTTGHELQQGIKILVKANIEFHELYGLSLNITDIDPNYTLGDLAQKKAEVLKKLEEEGVLNMNKEVSFPLVPQRIAIISSETAAGYQDFINQLQNNSFNFKFYTKLFPATMQGLKTEESIVNALEKIYSYEDFFDIVVIIRGGGSQADLNSFNTYLLAANIAQFPLPVLTGIGHEKDESIVDIVAHKKLKTPTAVAEYIIEKTSEFENNLFLLRDDILDFATVFIQNEKTKLVQKSAVLIPTIKNKIGKNYYHLNFIFEKFRNVATQIGNNKANDLFRLSNSVDKITRKTIYSQLENINSFKDKIKHQSKRYTQKQNLIIENLSNRTVLLNPENILKRGYSITYFNGEKLKDLTKINENDEIITKLFSGKIRSTVREKTGPGKA